MKHLVVVILLVTALIGYGSDNKDKTPVKKETDDKKRGTLSAVKS